MSSTGIMNRSVASLGVSCHGVVLIYRLEGYDVVALAGVDLEIQAGESVALVGPSGAGKSTLMAVLAGLLHPSAGRIHIGEHDLVKASERELQLMRAHDVGVVLQGAQRNLLPYLSVEQNVRFAQRAAARGRRHDLPPARDVLALVGLAVRSRLRARPADLTPGERQRLALAVALACRPGLLLADEPTSQLDTASRDEVLSTLQAIRASGTTVVVVTHDPDVGHALGRQVTIRDGRVGAEGHHGATFAVVGRDGSVHLPAELMTRYPAGTLMSVFETDDGVLLLPAGVDANGVLIPPAAPAGVAQPGLPGTATRPGAGAPGAVPVPRGPDGGLALPSAGGVPYQPPGHRVEDYEPRYEPPPDYDYFRDHRRRDS